MERPTANVARTGFNFGPVASVVTEISHAAAGAHHLGRAVRQPRCYQSVDRRVGRP